MQYTLMQNRPIGEMKKPNGFGILGEAYFDDLAVNQYSPRTIICKRNMLKKFVDWCIAREISLPEQVTSNIIESFQRYLHHYRQDNGKPLTPSTQRIRLTAIKVFFEWLSEKGHLVLSPARYLKLPSVNQTLPKHIFNESDVEQVLNMPDIKTVTGLRNRAMMEVLYSSAIRRLELVNLNQYDVDIDNGVLRVRHGKGNKDRIVPVGKRALHWVCRYLEEARGKLIKYEACDNLFISTSGKGIKAGTVSSCFQKYIQKSGVKKGGSCHIFRHSAATLMLENGADIRVIQSMLGHASLATTQIYTKVSIKHLKEVHQKTHPAK